jgi:hypothetical protein
MRLSSGRKPAGEVALLAEFGFNFDGRLPGDFIWIIF